MNHERSQPERRERATYPESGKFNLGAMSDEQIILLGRALDRDHERMCKEGGHSHDEVETTARLLEHLGNDIARMTVTQPERGRELLMQLTFSDNIYERNIAVAAAIPLGLIDYPFAREMLFRIDELHRRDGDEGVEGGVSELTDLLQENGCHEQAADLQRRWYERSPDT